MQTSELLRSLTKATINNLPTTQRITTITDLAAVVLYLNYGRDPLDGLWSAKVNENGAGSISRRKRYTGYESGDNVWGVWFKSLEARLSGESGKFKAPNAFVPNIDLSYQPMAPTDLYGNDDFQDSGMDFDGLVKRLSLPSGFKRTVILPVTFEKIEAIPGIINTTLVLTSERRVYLDGLLEKTKSDLGSKAKQVQAIQARIAKS